MKRNTAGSICCTLLISALWLFGHLHLWAQASRDDYRAAYRAWREAEPNLEIDAATAGDAVATRASRAAAEEAEYSAARSAFLRQLAAEFGPFTLSLQATLPPTPPSPAPAPLLLRFVATQTSSVSATIAALANDTDPIIRPLQQALDRERSALSALNSAIGDRQKAEDKATLTVNVTEQRRNKAIEQYQNVLDAVAASADSVDRETAVWAVYYQKLAEGARANAAPDGDPVSSVPGVRSNQNPALAPAPPDAAVPVPRTPSITTLPLPRYTGAWTYSTVGGMFHGAEPEFVDLVVHEENGKANGTFYARFKLPPGSSGDPLVQFDFSGDFRADPIQAFTLETTGGAKGTINLIPGNGFNLLEVTFETEIKPGKVHLGDVLLVKK